MFWVWVIGGLFIILFMVWLFNRNKKNKKSESSFDAGDIFDFRRESQMGLGADVFDIFD